MSDLGDLAPSLDPPLAVVTTAVDGEIGGCLVGFHCQCGIEPDRYAIWLSAANHTTRLARTAPTLAVHLLGDHQHELARHFGTLTGDVVDKFADVDWQPGPDGVPLLDAVPFRVIGRRGTVLDDGGDHLAVVLHDLAVEAPGPLRPLRLHRVDDLEAAHPAGRPTAGPGSGPEIAVGERRPLG